MCTRLCGLPRTNGAHFSTTVERIIHFCWERQRLARIPDLPCAQSYDQYVATLSIASLQTNILSASAAGVATEAQSKLHELDFLQKMRIESPQHPGYAHVVHLKDHFYQDGPSGRHLCLVMDPLLEDLRVFSLRWRRRLMPLPAVRCFARQIILGLRYLHDECNIIHTGKAVAVQRHA